MRRWLRRFLLRWLAPLETFQEIEAVLPDAAIEAVGLRAELVIYTGWADCEPGERLLPYVDPEEVGT